jgi:spermidine/putrescine transport system permease protein
MPTYISIIILIVNSFNSSRFGINWQGFTTNWYSLLMNNDSLLQAAQHSLTMAIVSATFATLAPDRRGALSLSLSRQTVRQRDAVCGDDVAGYRDGDFTAGAVYAAGRTAASGRCCFPITFCLFVVVTVYSRLKGFDVQMLKAKDLGPAR